MSCLSSAKLNLESMTTVNNLIDNTVQQIKAADDHQVRSKPKHRSDDEDFELDSEHESTESDDEIQICEICDTE